MADLDHRIMGDYMITDKQKRLQEYFASKTFVRSQFQIGEDTPNATGKRSAYAECVTEFGETWPAMLEEIYEKCAAVLPNAASHNFCNSPSCTQKHTF